uniref:Phospholipase A2 n=1 Tax=Caenorhabditis tropicalis TaxID=1561998 RepID=A0A1I7TNY0_9PELO
METGLRIFVNSATNQLEKRGLMRLEDILTPLTLQLLKMGFRHGGEVDRDSEALQHSSSTRNKSTNYKSTNYAVPFKKEPGGIHAALNHCCAIHDDCYGQQNGQNKCDEEFCECNRMVTRLPTEEGYKCRATTQDACVILQLFGGFAYGDSNYTDPAKGSGNVLMTPKTLPKTEGDYMNLYSKCPHVNITLASCAFNFDLCALAHSADFCANDLCHCMLDAAESDRLHKKECLPAVAHTCRAVLKHSSLVLAHDVAMKNFVNSCFVVNHSLDFVSLKNQFLFQAGLLILAACSFGFGLFFMYARVGGYRKKQHDDGKYIPIHTVESSRSVNPLLLNAD